MSSGSRKLWLLFAGASCVTLLVVLLFFPLLCSSQEGGRVEVYFGEAKLWDAETSKEIANLSGFERQARVVMFAPTGETLAVAGEDQNNAHLKLFDPRTGKLTRSLMGHRLSPDCIAFAPNGKTLLSAESGQILFWDLETNKATQFLGQNGLIERLVFARDGKSFASSDSRDIRYWDLEKRTCKILATIKRSVVRGLALTPDGKYLIATEGYPTNAPGTLMAWELASGKKVLDRVYRATPIGLTLSPDDQIFAVPFAYEHTKVFDMETKKEKTTVQGTIPIAFSPDGDFLVTSVWGSAPNFILNVWNTKSGEATPFAHGHREPPKSMAFSPNGKLFATGGGPRDMWIKVWAWPEKKLLATLGNNKVDLLSLAFSPDSKTLASAGWSVRYERKGEKKP